MLSVGMEVFYTHVCVVLKFLSIVHVVSFLLSLEFKQSTCVTPTIIFKL